MKYFPLVFGPVFASCIAFGGGCSDGPKHARHTDEKAGILQKETSEEKRLVDFAFNIKQTVGKSAREVVNCVKDLSKEVTVSISFDPPTRLSGLALGCREGTIYLYFDRHDPVFKELIRKTDVHEWELETCIVTGIMILSNNGKAYRFGWYFAPEHRD